MARRDAREFWPASNCARERFADNWRCGILHRSVYRQWHADGAGEWRIGRGSCRRPFGRYAQRWWIRRIERTGSIRLRKVIQLTVAAGLVLGPTAFLSGAV